MGLWTADVHGDAVEGADTVVDGEGFPFIRVAARRARPGASPARTQRIRGGARMRAHGMDAEGRDSACAMGASHSRSA
jgi:hypothetical protein